MVKPFAFYFGRMNNLLCHSIKIGIGFLFKANHTDHSV